MSTVFLLLELIAFLTSWLTLPPRGAAAEQRWAVRGRRRGQSRGDLRRTFIFLSVFDCLVVPGKKKVWNWASYLEEERMPAAPLKLFREVGSFFSSLAMFFSGNIPELLSGGRTGDCPQAEVVFEAVSVQTGTKTPAVLFPTPKRCGNKRLPCESRPKAGCKNAGCISR